MAVNGNVIRTWAKYLLKRGVCISNVWDSRVPLYHSWTRCGTSLVKRYGLALLVLNRGLASRFYRSCCKLGGWYDLVHIMCMRTLVLLSQSLHCCLAWKHCCIDPNCDVTWLPTILCSYEALLQEERLASQEVTAFERKLETWSSTQQSTAPRLGECAPRPPVQTSASTMPPAVLSFEVCDDHPR